MNRRIPEFSRWLWSAALVAACGGATEDPPTPNGGSGGGITPRTDGSKSGALTTPGPHFVGSGVSYRPLTPGCGADTAEQCGGTCEGNPPSSTSGRVSRAPATLCFQGGLDPTPTNPTAVIEQVIEEKDGREVIHLRVTFDPSFVDNTYGENACCGWHEADDTATAMPGDPMIGGKADAGKAGKAGHTFEDLVGSDHVELLLTNGAGDTVMDFKLDYISEDSSAPCGYATLGVEGGEGKMIVGDASAVLGVATSIDRNLNGCGYCYIEDSPATDQSYTPNPDAPDWDYRVVYEVWIDLASFGAAGFGQAYITNVHASPSKLESNTVEVDPKLCPPEWDTPFCHPSVIEEGRNCFDQDPDCPPNYTIYVATEGKSWCTPIPFSNYPGRAPCPEGYALDAASEGRYCLPVK
jgi:hypothetical protein